jgi:hypothetical protein
MGTKFTKTKGFPRYMNPRQTMTNANLNLSLNTKHEFKYKNMKYAKQKLK